MTNVLGSRAGDLCKSATSHPRRSVQWPRRPHRDSGTRSTARASGPTRTAEEISHLGNKLRWAWPGQKSPHEANESSPSGAIRPQHDFPKGHWQDPEERSLLMAWGDPRQDESGDQGAVDSTSSRPDVVEKMSEMPQDPSATGSAPAGDATI